MAECEFCKGSGKLHLKTKGWDYMPCLECNGTGIQHCCEGLQADPVVDAEWPDNPAEISTFGRK